MEGIQTGGDQAQWKTKVSCGKHNDEVRSDSLCVETPEPASPGYPGRRLEESSQGHVIKEKILKQPGQLTIHVLQPLPQAQGSNCLFTAQILSMSRQ